MRDVQPQPAPMPAASALRATTSIPFDPYQLSPYAEELLRRRVMLSPVLVVWQYRITREDAFKGWLSTREILLSKSRMSSDAEIGGVRYGGTYAMAMTSAATGANFKTVWGYVSEAAMQAMHRLCGGTYEHANIVQLELIDFVKGVKKFSAEAGDKHFTQEVLISAAAGRH